MTLDEFMNLTDAWCFRGDTWFVEITLKDLTKSTININNCKTEFEAKERAYLYLLEKIHKPKQ